MVWVPKLDLGRNPPIINFFVIHYHPKNCEDLPTIAFKLQCIIILKYIIFKLRITFLD